MELSGHVFCSLASFSYHLLQCLLWRYYFSVTVIAETLTPLCLMVMYLHTPHIPIQFMAGNNNYYSLLVRGEIGRQLVNKKNKLLLCYSM